MSASGKKPVSINAPGRRPSTDSTSSPQQPKSGVSKSFGLLSGVNGSVVRTRSTRTPASARTAMQRPIPTTSNSTSDGVRTSAEDEAHERTIATLDDVKEDLRSAQNQAERLRRENETFKLRLDEALLEQNKLEERLHEGEEQLEFLENEKRDVLRQKREMEAIYEAEMTSMSREREESANREDEMQSVIQRLKENLTQRSVVDEESRSSRRSAASSPNLDSGQFAPPSTFHRNDSRNNSKIVLQKDRLIESLRLELAEAQIKLVESENVGGGRMYEVERLLQETRISNAKLIEENESFQLLLSENTLSGDFVKNDFAYGGSSANADALSALEGRPVSLADELSGATEEQSEHCRRLESDLKSSQDQNRALTLYINKIIERLLQHQDFEAILDQSSEFRPGAASNLDKDLPPPPPPQVVAPSMLERARFVALGPNRSRTRPISQMPAQYSAITDPGTAPSIPFGLGRTQSVRKGRPQSDQYTTAPANVVSQMYKGPVGQISPPLHGPQTPRSSASFFTGAVSHANPAGTSRQPSGASVTTIGSLAGGRSVETSSIESGDVSTPSTSPPRIEKAATLAGNKPRPLRLVQDQAEAKVEEDKKNRRASWMGWAMNAVGKKEDISVDSIQE